MKRVATACLCALALASAAGCSQDHYDERGKADAPVKHRTGENTAAEVYEFPDGFGNLATKCVGKGKRGYATTKTYKRVGQETFIIPAREVIVDDPDCPGTP